MAKQQPASAIEFLRTLPGQMYWDQDTFRQEQDYIFSQMWICAARADALPVPGAYLLIDIGRESVIVVRDGDGGLHAFLNVCHHRGARLCTELSGRFKGSIQCRYHAWTYGLNGKLIGAPQVQNVEGFDREEHGLVPVALQVWEGFIWLNLSEDAEPLELQTHPPIIERLGDYTIFARYGVEALKVGKTITYEIEANWKLIIENYLECYHCPSVHPELCQLLPGFRTGTTFLNGNMATLGEGFEAFTITGRATRPPLPGLLAEDLNRCSGMPLLPNVLLDLMPDQVVFRTLWPTSPNHTRVVCNWLFDPTVVVGSEFDPSDTVELFDLVNRQDFAVCELVQGSVKSRAFESGGIFVPAEAHIRKFCDFVIERLCPQNELAPTLKETGDSKCG